MAKSFGCVGILLALALVTGLVISTAPGLSAVLGLYSYVIGKGAFDGIIGRPMFAKLVSFDRLPVNKFGDIGNAVVEYTDGKQITRARVDLLPRPISPYRIGEPIPVLVNRVDPGRAKYDTLWMHRPEHRALLAPIWKMAVENSKRSEASRH
jgi:hypothetical protein